MAENFIKKLEEQLGRARRRRRRRSPVPFYEWVTAFKLAQMMIAGAYNRYVEEKGMPLPLFGAVFRIALNRVLLPALRDALAEKPGVETPEEIAKTVISILDKITVDDIARALREGKYVPEEQVPEYARAVADVLAYIKEFLKKLVGAA